MTNRKDQITELTGLNDELENYFANTIIPQLFVDAELIIRKFTPPAMKQFDLKSEHIGMPLEQVKENLRFPTIIDNINVVIATGKILEKEIQTIDRRWYQMNILPYLIRKENKTNGVIITFVDITPRIRDLKEQERIITEHELLLDTISHDIKNPILGIGLSLEILKKLPKKNMEQFPKLINNIENSLFNMKTVIGELLDTRWLKERAQASEELIDLGNILEDVRLTLAPQILESGANVLTELQVTEITFIRRKIRSVLHNLIGNAIKYTPAGQTPELLIKSYLENGQVVISVTDNGIGMDEGAQQRIFDKFQRVRSDYEGTGVGLYLVHTIITSAGGKISIDSEPGKGSTFSIYLGTSGVTIK